VNMVIKEISRETSSTEVEQECEKGKRNGWK